MVYGPPLLLLVIAKVAVLYPFKELRIIAVAQLVSLHSHLISPFRRMAIDPPSSPEVVVRLIHNLQTDNYAKLSAAIMFILDYGAYIFDRMTLLVFDSPQ
jgi:hypothetical protein